MPIEKQVLQQLIQALPQILRTPIEAQLNAYNLVQREIDGRALNFYRKKLRHLVRDDMPPLPVKTGEIKLLGLSFSISDFTQKIHATATAIDKYFFCISFSHDLRPFATHNIITIVDVTQSWRSNIEMNAPQGTQPDVRNRRHTG